MDISYRPRRVCEDILQRHHVEALEGLDPLLDAGHREPVEGRIGIAGDVAMPAPANARVGALDRRIAEDRAVLVVVEDPRLGFTTTAHTHALDAANERLPLAKNEVLLVLAAVRDDVDVVAVAERAGERTRVVATRRVPREAGNAEPLIEGAVGIGDVRRVDHRREAADLHVKLTHEQRVSRCAHAPGNGERVRPAERRAREQRVLGRHAELAELREVEALGGIAEERIEDRLRRAAGDELGDDHLRGLLHRREPKERNEPVDREHGLRGVELDRPTEEPEERRRSAARGARVEPVAVGLEPSPRVGTKLGDVAIEPVDETERAHGAIDGPRELALAEHREELPPRRREHQMHLHQAIGRVHVAAGPGGLGEVPRVDGGVAELVALDTDLAPRSRELHRAPIA